ncbi:MAG TPA: porin family protein [Bacteroidales bacterium]|nr:porin family protein [Bacteroidales bacterium]
MTRPGSRILFSALLLFLVIPLQGQKQKPKNVSWFDDKLLHFGFSIGFNTMDFNITPSLANMQKDSLYPSVSKLNPGINIQIVTDLRLNNYMDLRFLPGVSFGERNIRFYKQRVLVNEKQRLESSFLEFPLLLKVKGNRLNNVRPYLIGGLNFRYDLAGKKEYDQDKPVYIRIQRPDLYYECGSGMDIYLPYFKLSIELKVSTGITKDVLIHDPASMHPEYMRAIEKMRSQVWIIAFHFE